MAWSDEIVDGHREALGDGAGTSIVYRGTPIPAMNGSGFANPYLVEGGTAENASLSFTLLMSDIRSHRPGWMPAAGDIIEVDGKELKVFQVSNNPPDPTIRIMTEGPEQ